MLHAGIYVKYSTTPNESFKIVSDIISNLKKVFRDQGTLGRQAAMRTVMSTNMTDGTPVQEHVLKIMDSLNELDVMGAEIDAESQIDIILELLPDSFNNFKLNYKMNKMSLTLPELASQLVAAEGIIKKPSVNITEKSYARSKPKSKGQKGKKKSIPRCQKVENGPSGGMSKANKGTSQRKSVSTIV